MPYKDKEKRREYQKEYMRKWYEKNKAKHIAYVRNRDKKIKLSVKEYKETLGINILDTPKPKIRAESASRK